MSKQLFDKVADSIVKDHPSFKIRYKNESRLMALLGLLAYPFNESFVDGYITTLGSTVYFPSRDDVERNYSGAADTLAHEGVHIFDAKRYGVRFTLSYALNQLALLPLMVVFAIMGSWVPVAALLGGVALTYSLLAITMKVTDSRIVRRGVFFAFAGLSGLAYLVLAVWLSGWWTFLAVAAFAPLLPLSSHWRAKWEYRGYSMGIAIAYWTHGSVSDSFLDRIAAIFTGPDYYYMDKDAERVRDTLRDIRASVLDGTILLGALARPYQRTLDVYKGLGLVKISA